MNDKTKSKVDSKIETETLKDDELGDEALEQVSGGVMPRIRRGGKGLFNMDAGSSELMTTDGTTLELFSMDAGTDD